MRCRAPVPRSFHRIGFRSRSEPLMTPPSLQDRSAARPAALPETAFVSADAAMLAETLCVQEERVVARDNTVSYGQLKLQLPESPLRHHFVKARVRVHQYPDGALAIFHGPRCLARYSAQGTAIVAAPTSPSVTPCSPPSRTLRAASGGGLRPSLTAAARDVTGQGQVGTEKRPQGRTKKPTSTNQDSCATAAA